MHVPPAVDHVPEELVQLHVRPAAHDGTDVPVAVPSPGCPPDRDRVGVSPDDDARLDRVDGRSVGRDDVDPEVERGELALGAEMEARVAERAANRMRRIERLDRPAVSGGRRGQEQNADEEREERRERAHAPVP